VVEVADGQVDLEVRTIDVWTLSPTFEFSRNGGDNRTSLGIPSDYVWTTRGSPCIHPDLRRRLHPMTATWPTPTIDLKPSRTISAPPPIVM
ncbi:hypothetical protein, partial [Dokdonella sp.]|uniref:hypothetical protein n=1 Tax=Dokdonella sp. TaxID=2291710 RepID=UPI00321F9313